MNNRKISVIIPAYNEASTIGAIVLKIKSLHPDVEIIVVNDGSVDETAAIAKDAGAHVYSHPYNIGNGAAIKSGIRIAGGDILVFMDGDNQHNPEDIAKLLRYIPDYDMVVGSRSNGDQASLGRTFGNTAYNWLASYVAKFYIPDLTSGFRAIKADIARNFLYLLPNTYSYPSTLTLCVLRSGRSIKYMPINVLKRTTGKSEISPFKDGVRFLMIIIKICTLYLAFEGISSGQFWIVRSRIIVLSVYIRLFRSFFQYELTSVYDLYYYFYDGTCLRANLSDEVRAE